LTVDTYGHLIPGANVAFVDRLDAVPSQASGTGPQQSAIPAQPEENHKADIPTELIDLTGGGGWTRTNDLRIMSRQSSDGNKGNQRFDSAESGKPLQNPQPPRNKETS